MKKIFLLTLLIVYTSVVFGEVVYVTKDKNGQSLFYGTPEKFVTVGRYVWYNGQEKLDLCPDNAHIYGIGVGYSEDGNYDMAKSEAMHLAERDFRLKMKKMYFQILGMFPDEEFFNKMITHTAMGIDSYQKKLGEKTIIITYCVYEISRANLKKYYPEVLEATKDLEN